MTGRAEATPSFLSTVREGGPMDLRTTLVVLAAMVLGTPLVARGGNGGSPESLNPQMARPVRESRLVVSCRAVEFKSRVPALREETSKMTALSWHSFRQGLCRIKVNVQVTIPLGEIANWHNFKRCSSLFRVNMTRADECTRCPPSLERS